MNTNSQSTINSKSPVLYQNGIIDIFKLQKIFELNINKVKKKGEVSSEMVRYLFYFSGSNFSQEYRKNKWNAFS